MKYNGYGQPLDVTAHKLVAHVAQEMAGVEYETLAHRDEFYKIYKSEKEYIRYRAPLLRQMARETLGSMLAMNDVSDAEKATIHEALVLDNYLPKSGSSVMKK